MNCNCSLTHRQITPECVDFNLSSQRFKRILTQHLLLYFHCRGHWKIPFMKELDKILKVPTFTWWSWKVYDDIHSPFWLQVNLQSRTELEENLEWLPKQVTAHAGNKKFLKLMKPGVGRTRVQVYSLLPIEPPFAKRCWGLCTLTEVKNQKSMPLALGKLESSEFCK